MQNQTSTGPGNWVTINPALARTIQAVITGSASVDIEVSNDGVNAVKVQTGITASGGYVDNDPWQYVRANVTSLSSGAVSVIMGTAQ
jgi:uncharacterized membrane protein